MGSAPLTPHVDTKKTRQKAVIFGVGSHGRATFRNLRRASEQWDVVAFVDNDPAKQGTMFGGIPIHAPEDLRSLEFDCVMLAGRNTGIIRQQLHDLVRLPEEAVCVMNRSALHPSPEETRRKEASIDRMLRFITDRFEAAGVRYWADYSALLALRRAQNLSDFLDVDLSISADDVGRVLGVLADSPPGTTLSVNSHAQTTRYWKNSDVMSVVLSSDVDLEVEEPAIIDMHTLFRHADRLYVPVGAYILYMPEAHYAGYDRISYRDMSLRVPLRADEHLALLYGAGWRTPAEYWHADSYGNIVENLMTQHQPVEIHTPRFLLRELREVDVSERYLSWFGDDAARKYITAASATRSLDDLKTYVRERTGRPDVLFLGIFDAETGTHVGNIKYEPVDLERRTAVMGILIGDPAYRGGGVAREVLQASAEWLKRHRGIREIALGVTRSNTQAIKAYEKAGFVAGPTDSISTKSNDALTMVWKL